MLLDPHNFRMDDILRRPYDDKTPFGSSGNCLWATSPQGWGFAHDVHWLHAGSGLAPLTLKIFANDVEVIPGDAISRPSHVTLHGVDPDSGLQITEDKFITQDDVLVAVLSIRNPSDGAIHVKVEPIYDVAQGLHYFRKDIPVWVKRNVPPGDDLRQSLHGEGRRTLIFAVAFDANEERAEAKAAQWARDTNAVWTHAAAYQKWFDENIPRFDCSDPWMTKMWYHRWQVVKKNHSRPLIGATLEDTFSEGRWRSAWYSASITYGAGHVLREIRWLRDAKYARNYMRGFARNQRADGLFRSWYVDGIARPTGDEGKYTDWITSAVYDLHRVHPSRDFLRETLPSLVKNVDYWQTHASEDGLLIVDDHWWTGMEWSPSFFYKTDYVLGERRDGRDVQNPVKRVDLTAYQYRNLSNLAAIAAELGEDELHERFSRRAQQIAKSVKAKMWDAETKFFYDLLPENDEKMLTAKNITGFYPFYADLTDSDYLDAWAHLTNPAEFWTAHPPASASQDTPAFSQEPTMRGKPVTGCYWNGPTWPHSISLVATGLTESLQRNDNSPKATDLRKALFDMIVSFGRAQFENGDFERTVTGEFYRGDTAQWMTPERDYHHSTWADLIITGLIGIRPETENRLSVAPQLPTDGDSWSHFCLENLPYCGRLLTVVWDDPAVSGDVYDDGDKGLTLYADQKRVHHQDDLLPFSVDLPPVSR